MGWKCAPQIKGLTREKQPKGKARANGERTLKEAGSERISKSMTLDRSRSALNEYTGYESGVECWQAMCDEADEYRVKGKTKNGKEFERRLQERTVIGFAVVFNPPSDVTVNWTPGQYEQFMSDAWECLEEIEPRVFRWDNLRMYADHKDEGCYEGRDPHRHLFGVPKDAEGHYCGNIIDSLLKRRINQDFPRMMREKGWTEMEDLNLTDWDKFKADEDYQQERVDYWKGYGNRVNNYIAGKHIEEQASIDAKIDIIDQQATDLNAKIDELNTEQAKFKQEQADLKAEKADVAQQKADNDKFMANLLKKSADMEREIERRANIRAKEISADFEAEKQRIRLKGKPTIGSKLKGLISHEKLSKTSMISRTLADAPDRVAEARGIVNEREANGEEREVK